MEATRNLLALFRTGAANEPTAYVLGIGAVLAEYPADVVAYVCDPRTGLPGRCKFLPTISEVRDACEAEMAPIRRAEAERERAELYRRERAGAATISEAQRERVGKGMAALAAQLRTGDGRDAEAEKRRAGMLDTLRKANQSALDRCGMVGDVSRVLAERLAQDVAE